MKATLVVILFAISAFAQNQTEPNQPAEAACGPATTQFDTQSAPKQAMAQPEAGNSQVYVIEVFDKVVGEIGHPTLRIGLDGAWMGADKGNSYLTFPVDQGEHHLCAKGQSRLKRISRQVAFTGFTAEAGKNYYFRARATEHGGSTGASNFSLDLDPVNADEGKFLVASSDFVVSCPKN
jgi:hypothetical protein